MTVKLPKAADMHTPPMFPQLCPKAGLVAWWLDATGVPLVNFPLTIWLQMDQIYKKEKRKEKENQKQLAPPSVAQPLLLHVHRLIHGVPSNLQGSAWAQSMPGGSSWDWTLFKVISCFLIFILKPPRHPYNPAHPCLCTLSLGWKKVSDWCKEDARMT